MKRQELHREEGRRVEDVMLYEVNQLAEEYRKECAVYNALQFEWQFVQPGYEDALIYRIKACEARMKALRKEIEEAGHERGEIPGESGSV